MLLTITAVGQQADLLPRMLGMDFRRQYQIAIPDAMATLYFPQRADANSHAALFTEVIAPESPARGRARIDHRPAFMPHPPSPSHLSAAIRQGYRLNAGNRAMRRWDRSSVDLQLRVGVRNLFRPTRLAQAEESFSGLGWNTVVTEVPFGDLPTHWGKTGFIELTIDLSATLRRALEHLSDLMPLLASQSQTEAVVKDPEGPVPLSELVAPFVDSGGYNADDGLYYPRQGLATQRIGAVLAVLAHVGARTVADLGCGRGDLLVILAHDARYAKVVGIDIDTEVLQLASRRIRLHWLPGHPQTRVRMAQGSILEPDPRLRGVDAAVLMEMLEHLHPREVDRAMNSVLGHARPRAVLVTTPNAEHTAWFPGPGKMGMRHLDHKFEWTRSEFAEWVASAASDYGYVGEVAGVGAQHATAGAPTQLALFTRRDSSYEPSGLPGR